MIPLQDITLTKNLKKDEIFNSNFNAIGEKTVTLDGAETEIIAYRGMNDIDIRLENGNVLQNSHCS